MTFSLKIKFGKNEDGTPKILEISKKTILMDIRNSFVRYWADILAEKYPSKKILFYVISAILNIGAVVFFLSFALRTYYDFHILILNQTATNMTLNSTILSSGSIVGMTDISQIFKLRFIKNWKLRVAIGLSTDILFFSLAMFFAFFFVFPLNWI